SAPTRGARSFLPGRGRGGRPVLLQRPAPPSPGGRGRSPRLVPPLPAEAERLRVRLAGERPLPARRPGVASGCSRRSGAPETTPPGARTAPGCSTPATSSLPRRGREGVRPPFPAGKGGRGWGLLPPCCQHAPRPGRRNPPNFLRTNRPADLYKNV